MRERERKREGVGREREMVGVKFREAGGKKR